MYITALWFSLCSVGLFLPVFEIWSFYWAWKYGEMFMRLCCAISPISREEEQFQFSLNDFKCVAVLGRGHFGKVTAHQLQTTYVMPDLFWTCCLKFHIFSLSPRSYWRSTRALEKCLPSKLWRKVTLWLVMRWTGRRSREWKHCIRFEIWPVVCILVCVKELHPG